jgi:hypothetical protein
MYFLSTKKLCSKKKNSFWFPGLLTFTVTGHGPALIGGAKSESSVDNEESSDHKDNNKDDIWSNNKDDIWSRFILPDRPQRRLQVCANTFLTKN